MKNYGRKVLFTVFLIMATLIPAVRAEPSLDPANPNGTPHFPPYIPIARFTNSVPFYTYQVVNAWPHDAQAFTEGLVFHDGVLFESTGLYGESSLRKVELETGNVLRQVALPNVYFAEGLALWNSSLVQLTWQNNLGFVYDLETFEKQREWTYGGEGWGLTSDGQSLLMSDGTNKIHLLDPTTFAIKRTLRVSDRGIPLAGLNELEYVRGEIYANVYGANYVLRIDPANGRLLGLIDFSGLLQQPVTDPLDILNGIAYDPVGDRLFVTGKRWPTLFEVRIMPYSPTPP
jgi:glutaminyl-peptide cyclotransferase